MKDGISNTLDHFLSIRRILYADLPYEVGNVVSNMCCKSYICMDNK